MSEHLNLSSYTTSIQNNTSFPQQQKKFNAHELNESEIKGIPESEKTVLMAMPGEKVCIWEEVQGKDRKYYKTTASLVSSFANSFFNMLEAINKTSDISHIGFGDFMFKLDHNTVVRTQAYKKSNTTGYPQGANKPYYSSPNKSSQYLADVMITDADHVREFLSKEENKGKWKQMCDPQISTVDGKVIVFLAKYVS